MAVNSLVPFPVPSSRLRARIVAIRQAMRQWGMTPAQVARGLGVSRQYVRVVLQGKSYVSDAKLGEIERLVREWSARQRERDTAGRRLRAARRYAGLTLKEAADLIGYSWVAVERWEKDQCLPKPGVLWHLRHVYGVGEDWIPATLPRHPEPSQTTPLTLGA